MGGECGWSLCTDMEWEKEDEEEQESGQRQKQDLKIAHYTLVNQEKESKSIEQFLKSES